MARIAFLRCMTQRYRAILHLIDPIIEAGHELTICVSNRSVDLECYRNTPCDVAASAPNTLKYLIKSFGITVNHFHKVKFTRKKRPAADLYLCYDDQNSDKALGIPYNTWSCFYRGKEWVVGNPMAEAIKNCEVAEVHGSVLIAHPGGGRGYISPQRKAMSKKRVTKENVQFLQKVLDNLPRETTSVRIKTHPLPYRRCTKTALEKFVVPHLEFDGPIEVVDSDLVGEISRAQLTVNFGGTTSIWLMGSALKRWVNVLGMDKYSASREKLIPKRGGGIPIGRLECCGFEYRESNDTHRWALPATANIMEKINELA